jgi:hypothetical protein
MLKFTLVMSSVKNQIKSNQIKLKLIKIKTAHYYKIMSRCLFI